MVEINYPSGEIVEYDSGDESRNDYPGIPLPPADPDRPLEIPLRNYRIRFNWDPPDEDRQYYADYSFAYNGFSTTSGLTLNNGITKDANNYLELSRQGVLNDVNGVFRTTTARFDGDWSMSFRINMANVSNAADGWAIVWATSPNFIGAGGGAVGYYTTAGPTSSATVPNTRAIAFRQYNYQDCIWSINGASTYTVTGKSWVGDYYYWVDYISSLSQIRIFRSTTNTKPSVAFIYLSNVTFGGTDWYLGITSATGSFSTDTLLKSWSLSGASDAYSSSSYDEDVHEGLAPGQSHAIKYKVEVQKKTDSGWVTKETEFTKNTHYVFHARTSYTNAELIAKYRARIWSVDIDNDLSQGWLNSNNGNQISTGGDEGTGDGSLLGPGDGAGGTGGRAVRVFNKVGLVRKREYESKWHADRDYKLIKVRAVVGKHDPVLHPGDDGAPLGSSIKINIRKYDADYDDDIYTNPPNGYVNLFLQDAKMEIQANKHRDVAWIAENDPDLRWTTILADESISIIVSSVGSEYPGSHLRIFMALEAL